MVIPEAFFSVSLVEVFHSNKVHFLVQPVCNACVVYVLIVFFFKCHICVRVHEHECHENKIYNLHCKFCTYLRINA